MECPECAEKRPDVREVKNRYYTRGLEACVVVFFVAFFGGWFLEAYFNSLIVRDEPEPCLSWEEAVPWDCVEAESRLAHFEKDFLHCAKVCCDKAMHYGEMLQEDIRCTLDKIKHEEELESAARVYGECLDRIDELEGQRKLVKKTREWERINELILSDDFNDRRYE
jgi:hypothetical protein